MTDERSRCYELLGLAPGASAEEIKAAHRDLVKVWHPDRFGQDPRLQQKAQEKLKELNEAYEILTSGCPTRRAPSAPPEARHEPPPPARGRARRPSLLLAALIFCALFAVASRTLWTRGAGPAGATERPDAPARTPPAAASRADSPATNKPAPVKKRVEAETSAPAPERAAPAPGALPTVTVLIDPTTGLLATPACPVRSRTTYAAGQEPRRPCDGHRK